MFIKYTCDSHSRPQSPSFLGHVVGLQIKPSGSGDENGVIQNRKHSACATRPVCQQTDLTPKRVVVSRLQSTLS